MTRCLSLAALAAAAAFTGFAAQAQSQSSLVIYGNDRCPVNTICVRSPESDRYRIPKSLRGSAVPAGQAPSRNAATSLVGGVNTGPASCSNSGGGGGSTCLKNQIQAYRAEKKATADAQAQSPEPR